MKLSWLNTSETHTNNTSMYMIWQYESMHKVRERVRESGSNANTRICFEVRVHSSTFPPSHRRNSTISSTQDFPHREPPPRIWGNYNLGVHNSSLNQYNLSLEAKHKANNYQPHTCGIRHLTTQPQSPLHLEGYQHNLHNLHNYLYLRGITTNPNKRRFTTLGGINNHKPIFLTKQWS